LLVELSLLGCSSSNKFPNGRYDEPTASAGAAGAGGSGTSNGGASGSAGAPASSAGSGGAPSNSPGTTQVYDFASSLGDFRINYYCSAADACVSPNAVVAAPSVDAGVDGGDAGADAAQPGTPEINDFVTASFDGTVGNPAPGSAKIDLQYSGAGQVAEFAINIAGVDLTGKTLSARVTMDPGSPTGSTAKLYIKTGPNYLYADSGQITLVGGSWSTLTYTTPSYTAEPTTDYDITDVREIGIELGPPTLPALTVLAPAIVHVDTIQY
jgi:hypothetical protein